MSETEIKRPTKSDEAIVVEVLMRTRSKSKVAAISFASHLDDEEKDSLVGSFNKSTWEIDSEKAKAANNAIDQRLADDKAELDKGQQGNKTNEASAGQQAEGGAADQGTEGE